ncbi:MAG: hypothetical protein IKN55_06325 [Oscillospiraceae bacterium]|nr:hypothetical protein [Oscillospiraceae bacterium]
MDQTVLDTLKRCYAGSREPVILLDQDWNILWQSTRMEIDYLPRLLGIPEDFWETCLRTVNVDSTSYTVQLLCNQADQIRIVTFFPAPSILLPMETELLSNVAHSLHSISIELHQLFEDNDLYDDMVLLMGLRGNCMRLYRPAYLQKELERFQAGLWQKERFSVKQQLSEMHRQIQRILGRSSDLTTEFCEETPYLCGDINAFQIAVLSAITMLYRDKTHRLSIHFGLKCEHNTCFLTVSMTPTPEERTDNMHSLSDFGSTYPEQVMLGCFCESVGGSWMKGESGSTDFLRITLPCEESSSSALMSFHPTQEGRFFNKYEIILARIHLLLLG